MPFIYQRVVRFQDTDAAGVVYFANILSMCHEAYEASLAAAGIDLRTFFSGKPIALPIVHAEADFSQPLFCGEQYNIHVQPNRLGSDKFEIHYAIHSSIAAAMTDRALSRAKTVHVCIQPETRTRSPLPVTVEQWLQHWSSGESSSS